MSINRERRGKLRPAENFDELPDSAYVRAVTVAMLRGCSLNTVHRHVRLGLLPAPVKLGPGVTAWNVGTLRRALAEAATVAA